MMHLVTFLLTILISPISLAISAGPIAARAAWPKRGLSYNDPSFIQYWNEPGSQINWAYNWASGTSDFPTYLEYVPMLWSNAPDHTNSWYVNANYYLSTGSGHLLSFNEPDSQTQANMSPQVAADAYRDYMMPFASRASLGAPAVTNSPGGLPWLESFINLCGDCKIDFVPVHWYALTSDVQYFQDYMNQAHNSAGGRDIWITELHAAGSEADQENFLNTVIPWLDIQPWISRYAWFMASPGQSPSPIVDPNGYPTALGTTYAYHGY